MENIYKYNEPYHLIFLYSNDGELVTLQLLHRQYKPQAPWSAPF